MLSDGGERPGSSFEIGAGRAMFEARPAIGERVAVPPITLVVHWPAFLKN
jgi:hypothetical protein